MRKYKIYSNFHTNVDQICTHLSKLPEAKNFPSGENATLYTGSVCFVSVWIHVPRSTSHSLTVESNEALFNEINFNSILEKGNTSKLVHIRKLIHLTWLELDSYLDYSSQDPWDST